MGGPSRAATVQDESEKEYAFIDKTNLVDDQGLNENGQQEVVIAIMGVTGSGKSFFIREVSGKGIMVGDGLEACTQHVEGISLRYKGVNLTLLDSPGFKDTYRSDTDVLYISSYLASTYSRGLRLSGFIYLHPISDVRMDGPSRRSLRMFRKLVGEEALHNVILATTHWSEVSEEVGKRRAAELQSKFWRPLMDEGARMTSFDGSQESAFAILDMLVNKERVTLSIQRETVDEQRDLIDTGAGQVLNEELLKLQRKYQEELQRHKEELEEADEKSKQEIAEIIKDMEDKLEEAERASQSLRQRGVQRDREQRELVKRLHLMQLAHTKEKATWEKKQNDLTKVVQEMQKGQAKAANTGTSAQDALPYVATIFDSAVQAFFLYLNMRS